MTKENVSSLIIKKGRTNLTKSNEIKYKLIYTKYIFLKD